MSNIIPPPELVREWGQEADHNQHIFLQITTKAAQWGADQELEACCHEVQNMYSGGRRLRAARRPNPPSLKEQALEALDSCSCDDADSRKLIRRALEQLDD